MFSFQAIPVRIAYRPRLFCEWALAVLTLGMPLASLVSVMSMYSFQAIHNGNCLSPSPCLRVGTRRAHARYATGIPRINNLNVLLFCIVFRLQRYKKILRWKKNGRKGDGYPGYYLKITERLSPDKTLVLCTLQ